MSLTTTEKSTAVKSTDSFAQNAPSSPSPFASPPEREVVVIEASSTLAFNGRELWAYRELLYFLTWRDIKIRYKQTALGALWAIIQPLFTMLIFSFAFGRAAGLDQKTGDIPYPLATYAALVPWIFFSSAVLNSGNSLVGSAHLISKVYFPRLFVPAAPVLAALVDFGISFGFLFPLMWLYGYGPIWSVQLLLLPFLVVLTLVLALAVGVWMSALNVKYRDIRYALPFFVQCAMFASPVFYWLKMIPEKWHPLFLLNPLTGILEGFRSALFGLPLNTTALMISAGMSALLLFYALLVFRRMEKQFADII